jgi:hypothetical protein
MDSKKAFYDYAASLGIKINDAQRLMMLANKYKPIGLINELFELWETLYQTGEVHVGANYSFNYHKLKNEIKKLKNEQKM